MGLWKSKHHPPGGYARLAAFLGWLVLTASAWMLFPVGSQSGMIALITFALLSASWMALMTPNLFVLRFLPGRWRAWFVFLYLMGIYLTYAALMNRLEIEEAVRAGLYIAVPLFLAYAGRNRKIRLGFFDLGIIVWIWLPIELDLLPNLGLPAGNAVIGLFHLLAVNLALLLYLMVRPLGDMGARLDLGQSQSADALLHTCVFFAVAIPIGLITGFLSFGVANMSVVEALSKVAMVFFFVAIPEEILFRGIIQNQMEKRFSKLPTLALLLSAIIFGLAHLNNASGPIWILNLGELGRWSIPWVYLILATLAGIGYGLLYRRSRSLAGPILMHTLVDCIWIFFFRG